jgi:O-antigen/teichoic acid export membrane protein
MTVLMCTAYTLTIPFIRLYTRGISDVGYADARLPLLFCLVQMLSWSRCVTGNLSGVAGYAKPVSRVSLAEALCNAVLSVALVRRFGIFGVLIATVASLPLKVVYLTWLSEKVILKRGTLRYPAILGCNCALFALAVLVNRFVPLQIPDVRSFLAAGAAVFLLCCVAGAAVNGIVNPDCLRAFREFFRKKA